LLQRENLILQRTELQLTRQQHTAAAEANRAAAKSLADQARLQLRSAQLEALTAQLQSCSSQIDQEYQRYHARATKTSSKKLKQSLHEWPNQMLQPTAGRSDATQLVLSCLEPF
jgi:lipid II:glycine glycyltransferase (peptidoglycan interpeptide bridge formation enzyme)